MNTYTIFCRQSNGEGTIYISSIEAVTPHEAGAAILEQCADAWDMDSDEIDVIGIAAGEVTILEWNDEPGSYGIDLSK